jgi:hypothetical protein
VLKKVDSTDYNTTWGTIAGAVYQASAPSTPQTGDVWVDSDAVAGVLNQNDYLLKADAEAPSGYLLKTSAASTYGTGLRTSQLLHVRDEKAQNTAGGTFTSGAWQTRVLNAVKTNTISGASVASNQMTLPAGTYWVEASAPAWIVTGHQAKLYNITDASDILVGYSVNGANNGAVANADLTRSDVRGLFTISGTKVIELQHRCNTTQATNGFGPAVNISTEVYSDVIIWKVA